MSIKHFTVFFYPFFVLPLTCMVWSLNLKAQNSQDSLVKMNKPPLNLTQITTELYPKSLAKLMEAPTESCESCLQNEINEQNKNDLERPFIIFYDFQMKATDKDGKQTILGERVSAFPFRSMMKWLKDRRGIDADEFELLSDEQKLEWMNRYGKRIDFPLENRSRAIEDAFIFYQLSKLGREGATEQQLMELLKGKMQTRSFDDKLKFMVTLLGTYHVNYDMARTEPDNPASEGKVSTTTMMASAYEYLMGKDPEEVPDAGVCRDMHQSAVRLARAMGLPESYGVSYITRSAAHLNMVVHNPQDRSKSFILNYGKLYINENESSAKALSQQGIADVGLGYTVWDADNRPLIYIPSERGAVLNIVTGGKDSDFDPQFQTQSSINQIGAQTPIGKFRFFLVDDNGPRDETLSGLAYDVTIPYNENFYGEYGVAGFYGVRNLGDNKALASGGVFFRSKQAAETTIMHKDNATIKSYGAIVATGTILNTTIIPTPVLEDGEKLESGVNFDGNGSAHVGVKLEAQKYGIKSTTYFEQQISAHSSDVQDSAQGITFYFPATSLRQELSYQYQELARIQLEGSLHYRPFGGKNFLTADAGAEFNLLPTSTAVSGRIQGAFDDRVPLFVPGSERKVEARLQQNFADNFYLFARGEKSFDFENQTQSWIGLGGNF